MLLVYAMSFQIRIAKSGNTDDRGFDLEEMDGEQILVWSRKVEKDRFLMSQRQ